MSLANEPSAPLRQVARTTRLYGRIRTPRRDIRWLSLGLLAGARAGQHEAVNEEQHDSC